MGGFKVDPSALDDFAKLLDRFTSDGHGVSEYIEKTTEIPDTSQGLVNILSDAHENCVKAMTERTALMNSIGGESAETVRGAAAWYRNNEEATAADLDSTYQDPAGGTDKILSENELVISAVDKDTVYAFKDVVDVLVPSPESCPSYTTLEPQVTDIENAIRTVGDGISIASWVRIWLKEILGFDPVESAVTCFTGDWTAFALCAISWEGCGTAVSGMSENLMYTDEALAQVWEGKAADAAIEYFQELAKATAVESDAFRALCEIYKVQVDVSYHALQIVNDEINYVVDVIAEALVVAGVTAVTGVTLELMAPFVWAIWEAASLIMTTITVVLDAIRLFRAAAAVSDLPEVPACELKNLSSTAPNVKNGAYHHPEVKD